MKCCPNCKSIREPGLATVTSEWFWYRCYSCGYESRHVDIRPIVQQTWDEEPRNEGEIRVQRIAELSSRKEALEKEICRLVADGHNAAENAAMNAVALNRGGA